MGLFDSKSTTNVSNLTDARQAGFEDIEGPAVGFAEGNVSIVDTDHGAVDAAESIALGGLEVAERLGSDALELGRDSIYAGFAGLEEVSNFAGDVLEAGRAQNVETAATLRDSLSASLAFGDRIAGDAIESSRAGASEVIGFAGDTVGDFLSLSSSLLDRVVSTVQDSGRTVVGAVTDTFARESTNTDARLEAITKYALIGGAIAVGAALYVASRK